MILHKIIAVLNKNIRSIVWAIVEMRITLLKIIEGILKKKNISTLNNYRRFNEAAEFWPSTRSKMPFKVMHRKEVTHSNGS